MDTVQFLFDFKGSRRELELNRSSICSGIEQELSTFGHTNVLVCLCCPEENEVSKDVFLLQRWSPKWQTFVDVSTTEDIYTAWRQDYSGSQTCGRAPEKG